MRTNKLAAALSLAVLLLSAGAFAQECESETAQIKALKEKESKLQDQVADLKSKLGTMVPKADLEAAKKSIEESSGKVKQLEAEVKQLEGKVKELEKQAVSAKKSAESMEKKAKEAAEKEKSSHQAMADLDRSVAELKASLKIAKNEAETHRKRADEAERLYKDLQSEHTSQWLPHWVTEHGGKALAASWASVQLATKQGAALAGETWEKHIVPQATRAFNAAKTHGAALHSAASQRLKEKGIEMPQGVKNAMGTVKVTLNNVAASDAVANAREFAVKGAKTAGEQAKVVVAELEGFLVQMSQHHSALAPLGQKPTSTVAVYVLLSAPVIAVLMPLLASSSSKASKTKKKNKTANNGAGPSVQKQQAPRKTPGKNKKK